MNKQELIDKAVIAHKGIFPYDECQIIILSTTDNNCWGEGRYDRFSGTAEDLYILLNGEPLWVPVCDYSEFLERAKALGFVEQTGYRWGEFYGTNGKKPELDDDVVIAIYYLSGTKASGWCVSDTHWSTTTSFRIIDERYKPVEQSSEIVYPIESGAASVVSSEPVKQIPWYDYEQQKAIALPPVGVEVEVKPYWHNAVIVCHRETKYGIDIVFWDKHDEKYDWVNFYDYLRPLDHATHAKELEKKRVVGAAYNELFGEESAIFNHIMNSPLDVLNAAYDKGFLKLPEGSDNV